MFIPLLGCHRTLRGRVVGLAPLAAIGAVVLAAGDARADEARAPSPRFELRADAMLQGGTEVYDLQANVQGVDVGSTLTYPVDMVLVGGRGVLSLGKLELVGALHTSVFGPIGKMRDQDYFQGFEVSHTDSRTEAKAWLGEIAVRAQVASLDTRWGVAPFSLIAGFRHTRDAFDIYGASGWVLGGGGTHVPVSLPDSVHGLHYVATYEIPFVGGRLAGQVARGLALSAEGRLLSAWSTHVDDHVYRNKEARAEMHAFGWSASAEARWLLSSRAFVGAAGELQVLHGSGGTLRQHFYADDPGTPGVEGPDTPIPDARFSYKSDRWRLMVFAGGAL